MNGEERRNQILQILSSSEHAVSGSALARQLQVSRQVIVQDIALLRANGASIFAGNRGYLLQEPHRVSRTFKVQHTDEEVEDELNIIVDSGAVVRDVFVYHKVYGVVRADMNIKSRKDVQRFQQDILSGKSSLLKNITSGYHYHTILADDEETLDQIQAKLAAKHFLAPLQDYEPECFDLGNQSNAEK